MGFIKEIRLDMEAEKSGVTAKESWEAVYALKP